ncbi:PAS domain-containing protein [Methylobacterium sp. J-001]|uniref:PAS domain-containing protein n=1 Tax=Methylobacterium sp. J-001 TaxID=2836609 RepID=UPI001FB963BA|nr:PAS domain-containing protein [Methylobacterium sp. J-001]MCJ2118507.1 PAS domain-containing protein [Methylobacterium sp. J-001]
MVALTAAVPALHAAGLIGIWNTDVAAGRSVLDEGAAAVMAGNPGLAGQPLPLEAALGRIHPDDRDWLFRQIRQVRRTGGSFSAEFRVLGEAGAVRWILNRGTISHIEDGRMQGLGAYIDTTVGHRSSNVPAALFAQGGEDPLLVAADRCIEAHTALKAGDHVDLRSLSELLLTSIGRTLARRLSS